MISRRLPADRSPNATARTVNALRARGVSILDLTVSNPTHVSLDYPPDLLWPLASMRGLDYDPHPLGLLAARQAVAGELARRGVAVPASHIALTASTSEAYSFLFKLFCDAGDEVLVPQPSYPLFDHLTRLESVAAAPYALEYHGAWRIDVESVRDAISARTRALIVVSPNNPTGSFLHADDLVQLIALCAAHELALIGDEVFADFPLDPAPAATSVLAQSEVVTCSLGGLSKSVGLPQLKLGWIAFAGPAAAVDVALDAYEVIADAFLSVSTPVQAATPVLVRSGARIRSQIQTRTRANLSRVRALAASYPAVDVLACQGGWSAVLRLPALESEERLVLDLLEADHVLVHPGYFFDFPREAFAVVSLLPDCSVFETGVSRLLARATAAS